MTLALSVPKGGRRERVIRRFRPSLLLCIEQ